MESPPIREISADSLADSSMIPGNYRPPTAFAVVALRPGMDVVKWWVPSWLYHVVPFPNIKHPPGLPWWM